METIRKQLAKARRRLWVQNWLNLFGWCSLIALAICFIGLLVPKIWYITYTFESWSRVWLIGSVSAAIAVSWLVAFLRRPSPLVAAVEIDKRFSLRERCSSALDLKPDDRDSAFGQALLEDAQRKLERIDVRDQFPIRPATQIAWTALPLAACLALFWVPDAELPTTALLGKTPSEPMVRVKNSTDPLLKAVQKKRQDAEDMGDAEAANEFKKIEEKLNSLQNANEVDRKKIIADLNAMKQELQQKRDALGGADRMKKSMEGLKELDKGPAEKMAKALKDGDIDQAEKELEKMIEGLKSGSLDAQQSKQLEKQLEQMKKALEEAQRKREQAKQDAERELAKAEKEGDTEKVAALREQLEKLQNGEEQSQAIEKVKAQLAKAQDAMKQGDKEGAAKALEELKDQLEEMAGDQENADDLEEMIEQFEEAKNASKCDHCNGEGCAECKNKGNQGKGDKGKKGNQGRKGNPKKPGDGQDGEGPGKGDRDEKDADFKDYDAQVRDEMKKGETVNGGKVGGKNRKGVTREETREAVLTAQPDEPDAIENIQLPKAQRDQLKEYFDSLRGSSGGSSSSKNSEASGDKPKDAPK